MNKWKYEKEIASATKALLAAYLATMHSKTITVIFSVENDVYYCDLNESEIAELTRVNGYQLMTQKISKKRIAAYMPKAVKFATKFDVELTKSYFPEYAENNGYIAEFLYRLKVTNETVSDIKSSNNSKGYDVASDTIDNKQIKNLDKGATFTKFEYLVKACEKANYSEITKVKKAIEFLQTIYATE